MWCSRSQSVWYTDLSKISVKKVSCYIVSIHWNHILSHDIMSGSEITPCNKIDNVIHVGNQDVLKNMDDLEISIRSHH